MLKQELVKIFWLKKEVFYIKTIIWKSGKKIKYIFSDFYVKINQKFNLILSTQN